MDFDASVSGVCVCVCVLCLRHDRDQTGRQGKARKAAGRLESSVQ